MMKKVIGLGAFALFGVLIFSSCKKEYTCTCTDGINITTETHKGKDAEDACNGATTTVPFKYCAPA
jgi:hypothetical protein